MYFNVYYFPQFGFSWVSKKEHGVCDFAGDVLHRLRRISNSVSKEELEKALQDVREWDRYKGKLKAWLEGN